MSKRAHSLVLLALGAVALVGVDAGVSKAQPMRQGREIARKIVLCDTQEQAKEILEQHATEGFAAGAVTYFKWKRTMNEQNQPSCDQGVWRFTPVRLVARFDQLEFGDDQKSAARGPRAASAQIAVRVEIRPRGAVSDCEVFQARARRLLKLIRSYFAAT